MHNALLASLAQVCPQTTSHCMSVAIRCLICPRDLALRLPQLCRKFSPQDAAATAPQERPFHAPEMQHDEATALAHTHRIFRQHSRRDLHGVEPTGSSSAKCETFCSITTRPAGCFRANSVHRPSNRAGRACDKSHDYRRSISRE